MTLAELIAQEACALTQEEQKAAKAAAAQAALGLVEGWMTLGLGTGSTVAYFLEGLGRRIKEEGLAARGVATSLETERLALHHGIRLVDEGDVFLLSNHLCVDGADRIDVRGNLIKGGGGALLREKLIAYASKRLCILADGSKLETVLGEGFPVPVECVPFGIVDTLFRLQDLGCVPDLRYRGDEPFVTDNGNYIADCSFSGLPDPALTEWEIKNTPGVVEVGLFVNMVSTLIIGRPDGTVAVWPAPLEKPDEF